MATKKNAKTKASKKKVTEKKPRYATLEPQKEEKKVVQKISKKEEEISQEKAKTATLAAVEKANAPKEVKRYETKILVKKEPIAKNIHAATYAYHESTNELSIILGENGAYGADIENLFINDILIIDKDTGAKSVVSRTENPNLWIQSLYKAELGRPYIAEEAVSYYEAE
jgi:phenylalanyl-tRNA synthetase alpha subunit